MPFTDKENEYTIAVGDIYLTDKPDAGIYTQLYYIIAVMSSKMPIILLCVAIFSDYLRINKKILSQV